MQALGTGPLRERTSPLADGQVVLARDPASHRQSWPSLRRPGCQVERWLGLLSQRAIRAGFGRSVADLVSKIQLRSSVSVQYLCHAVASASAQRSRSLT